MNGLDNVIAWVDYIVEWLMYGGKVVKAISNALSSVRNNWPAYPTIPTPKKVNNDTTTGNKESTKSVHSAGGNDKAMDSGISVRDERMDVPGIPAE